MNCSNQPNNDKGEDSSSTLSKTQKVQLNSEEHAKPIQETTQILIPEKAARIKIKEDESIRNLAGLASELTLDNPTAALVADTEEQDKDKHSSEKDICVSNNIETEENNDLWTPSDFVFPTPLSVPSNKGDSTELGLLLDGDLLAALQSLDQDPNSDNIDISSDYSFSGQDFGELTPFAADFLGPIDPILDNNLWTPRETGSGEESPSSSLPSDYNKQILLEPSDFSSVFEDSTTNILEPDPIVDTKIQQEINSAAELVSGLDNLNLGQEEIDFVKNELHKLALENQIIPGKESSDISQTDFGFGLPPYCLPCDDGSNNIEPIGEASASFLTDPLGEDLKEKQDYFESEIARQQFPLPQSVYDKELTEEDLDELVKFSELNMSTMEDNFDDTTGDKQDLEDKGLYDIYEEQREIIRKQHESSGSNNRVDEIQHDPQYENQSHYSPIERIRPKAKEVSGPMIKSFQNRKNERSCFGHKETIFGVCFSPCGKYCASASQDSTVQVWNVEKNKLLSTLKEHSVDHECLRVAWASSLWASDFFGLDENDKDDTPMVLASAGADGTVKLWKSNSKCTEWDFLLSLDHSSPKSTEHKNDTKIVDNGEENGNDENDQEKGTQEEEDGVPQIYVLQFVDKWQGLPSLNSFGDDDQGKTYNNNLSLLMTSSDDFIHLWEKGGLEYSIEERSLPASKKAVIEGNVTLKKVMDIRFTHLEAGFGGVFVNLRSPGMQSDNLHHQCPPSSANIFSSKSAYGGERNPENLVYVFDALHCPSNSLLGVALSDGTLRLVNGRGVCVCILQLPGCQSHLTSFCWDSTGSRLASCVATGHLIIWHIYFGNGRGRVRASCKAILAGGHDNGRPLYGARYCGGKNEELLLSWGVDGKLCVWDSQSEGEITEPLSVLVSKPDYPIYAVDVANYNYENSTETKPSPLSRIIVGGGRDGGFIGLPLLLYDIYA